MNLAACLFVVGSFVLFWDFLIDVEDTWDVELHAVEVISNHGPQLIQTRVIGLCNLRDRRFICFYSIYLLKQILEADNKSDFSPPALFAMACQGCCVLFCEGSFPGR